MRYTLLGGNDALRSYRTLASGLSLADATARAHAHMPRPEDVRTYAFVAVIPDGGSLTDAVLTVRGTYGRAR